MAPSPSGSGRSIEVFFSYAHRDEALRDELAIHLRLLERQGIITGWHDRRITRGTEWAGAIDEHLRTAEIILLLVSADFVASEYCFDAELRLAIERHEAGEARVVPIILRAVDWHSAPFGKLQALPTDGRPVTSWANQDEAFFDIARGIRSIAEELAQPPLLPSVTRPVGYGQREAVAPSPPGPRRPIKAFFSYAHEGGAVAPSPPGPRRSIEVFFSYAHRDEALRDELALHLRLLERQGIITGWHDRRITRGTEWAGAIDEHLRTAEIILLLVSADFVASEYCFDVELRLAIERHEAGEARVIPVILRAVDWHSAPFGKLQALPTDGRPVTSWANQDEAFFDIARGIRSIAEELAHFLDPPDGTRSVGYGQREASWRIEEARLTVARTLNLAGLGLSSLPESIGELSQLQQLDLSKNKLSSLPESIGQLSQLQQLYLHDNSGLRIPLEILGPTWDQVNKGSTPAAPSDILAYYFQAQKQPRPLNEAKLILVGYGAVGKTSLINRLVHNDFNLGETKTDGINITEWPLRLRRDEDVQLNIWDFGGQEILHATHQFFLTQRSLYLLVLNGRQGHEDGDVEYWLHLIESFGEDSPVIIVLNKIKEHPFDLNRRALQQKFLSIRGFVQTDCADKTGIDELRQMIERETDVLEHLRDTFPASWFTIKDQLSDMQKRLKKNYVTFDEYRVICAAHGEADGEAQERLAFYLHTLGIALNYRDDRRLQDTHVLNPQWVTNGIYKILNAEQLAVQRGEVRLGDLPGILDQDDYPQRMYGFLFDLMRKFELCFPFPDEDGRFLVPELLDKQQPEEAEAFDIVQCLNFEYHYPILPEGLLPRFIVRTHVLSAEQHRWKSGVILEFEGNRALVKADAQDKTVKINVSGPLPGRRRLLGIIRSDFEHIHRSFRFEAKEMVPVPGHLTAVVPYKHLLLLEKNGRNTHTIPIDNEILDVLVHELLDGVDLKESRKIASTIEHEDASDALQLFYSYSHKDERLRDELETHLKLLQRQGLITGWHDRRITAGAEWDRQIDQNLECADIILLLVSADFIASHYCYDIEMRRALERHASGNARVVPIIVRDVKWESTPFAKLQALPTDGRAVMQWKDDRDSAWRSVAEGIELVVVELRIQRDDRRRG